MYDGISKTDMAVILAHQHFISMNWFGADDDYRIKTSLDIAEQFLARVEEILGEARS